MDTRHYALLPPLEQGLAPFLASLQPGPGPGPGTHTHHTHTHAGPDSGTSAGAARAHDGGAHPTAMRASTRTSSRLQPLIQHSTQHYDYSDWINSHGHYDALDGATDVLIHPAPPPSSETALAASPSFGPYNPTKFALDPAAAAAASGSHHDQHTNLRASRRLSNVPGSQYFNASPFLANDTNAPPFHKLSMEVGAAFEVAADTFPPHPLQHFQGPPRSFAPAQAHVTRARPSHHQAQPRSSTSPSRHAIALAAAPNAEHAALSAQSSSPSHPRAREAAVTVSSMASPNSRNQAAQFFSVSSSTTQIADVAKQASTMPMTRSSSRSSPTRGGAEASAARKTPTSDLPVSTPTAAVDSAGASRPRRSGAADFPQDVANQPASDRSSRSKTAAGFSKPLTQEPDAEAALHLLRLAQPDGSVEDEEAAPRADARPGTNLNEDDSAELSDASSLRSLGVGSAFSTSTKATTVGSTVTVHPKGGPVGSATARARRGRMSNESTQSTGSPGLGSGPLFGAMEGVESYAAREWHYSDDVQQAPLRLPMPGYTSRAPSVASSNASASRAAANKSHRPARLQREAAAAAASALAQQAGGSSSRRLSSRTRKPTIEAEDVFDAENDDDFRSAYGDDGNDAQDAAQDFSESDDNDDDDGPSKRRGRARKSASAKGKGKGKAKPRASTASKRGSETPLNETPAKKSRTSTSSNVGSIRGDTPGSTFSTTSTTRQSRRQPVAPLNLVERTFPPEVEKCSASFPRFYRAFPLSSAFPPDSFVHRGTGLPMPTSATAGTNAASAIASSTTIPALTLPSLSSHLSASAQASTSSIYMEDNNIGCSAQYRAMLPPYPAAPPTSDTPPSSTLSFFDCPAGAKWHKGPDPFNIYMPRIVRGSADSKEGLCPVCVEPVARGGEGEEKWLKLKNSSFVYHMSYSHGLSNLTGLPFSPPVRFRRRPTGTKTKDTRDEMTDGMCHKCNEWIPLLSVKKIDTLIPELIWWKHAKKCHGESQIPGEGDFYVRDAMFDFVSAKKAQHGL